MLIDIFKHIGEKIEQQMIGSGQKIYATGLIRTAALLSLTFNTLLSDKVCDRRLFDVAV